MSLISESNVVSKLRVNFSENQKAAEDAVAALNGKSVENKVIRVNVADKNKHQEVLRSNVYVAGMFLSCFHPKI